jgi:hypothetical protein
MIRATIPKEVHSKQTAASVLIAPAGKKAADAPGSALPANKTTRSDSAIPSAHPPTVNEAPASPPPFLGNREIEQVGGPISAAWREGTLTRAKELESLCASIVANNKPPQDGNILARSVYSHIEAPRDAARVAALNPKMRLHLGSVTDPFGNAP